MTTSSHTFFQLDAAVLSFQLPTLAIICTTPILTSVCGLLHWSNEAQSKVEEEHFIF